MIMSGSTDPELFIKGLREKGLNDEAIGALGKRSGEKNLTEEDVFIMEEVRSKIYGKEVSDGSEV